MKVEKKDADVEFYSFRFIYRSTNCNTVYWERTATPAAHIKHISAPAAPRSGLPGCVYFVLLCLCEDSTGRDKGSPVGVFIVNSAGENSWTR